MTIRSMYHGPVYTIAEINFSSFHKTHKKSRFSGLYLLKEKENTIKMLRSFIIGHQAILYDIFKNRVITLDFRILPNHIYLVISWCATHDDNLIHMILVQ